MGKRDQSFFINSLTGKEDLIISSKDFFNRVKMLGDLETKALASILFLTGARINEIAGEFRVNQMMFTFREGHKFVDFIGVKTLKKRNSGNNRRTVPMPYDEYEGFFRLIGVYITANDLQGEDLMFRKVDRTYRYRIEKALGINPHRIRHIKNTLLAREFDFNDEQLRRVNNWSRKTTASEYTHLNVNDVAKKMVK